MRYEDRDGHNIGDAEGYLPVAINYNAITSTVPVELVFNNSNFLYCHFYENISMLTNNADVCRLVKHCKPQRSGIYRRFIHNLVQLTVRSRSDHGQITVRSRSAHGQGTYCPYLNVSVHRKVTVTRELRWISFEIISERE